MKVSGKASAIRYAISGVLAAAAIAGCVSAIAAPRSNKAASIARAQHFLSQGRADKAIPVVEAAVASEPRDAALRVLLGQAYLRAGRFESASAAFNDAMTLGENTSRTALSLALSLVATGHGSDAVGVLDDWRDSIPASDYGLALALAGETSRGVAVLSDAIRSGENTPKMRQNLAYAYALDGRWREARLMTQQDVPAGDVSDRIAQWAASIQPEAYQQRVAALVGVPVRNDSGMPQALALANTPSAEQLAAEAGAERSEQVNQQVMAQAELPPAAEGAAPALAMAPAPAAAPAVVEQIAAAPEAPPVAEEGGMVFVSQPVIQDVPARTAPTLHRAAPALAARTAAPRASVRMAMATPAPRASANGSHLVQLGSFASQQGARRAWGIYTARNPQLRSFRMSITQATVKGKNYWRVAAAGFDAGSAQGWCSSLRRQGGACFAYAAPRSLQAAPTRAAAGPQLARRR